MKIPFLSRLFERRSSLANPDKWLIDVLTGRTATATGVIVNEKTALQSTAVYAAVRILAETVASLPLRVYRRLQGGGKERDPGHSLYEILHDKANDEMSSFTFRETLMGHLATWGNAYAEIEFDNGGRVRGLWPLRPDHVLPERDKVTKRLIYKLTLPDGTSVILSAERVLHIPGLGFDGLIGYSPINMAREAIGLALATEEFGARFFSNDARPGGILEHPAKLSDDAHKRLRESWEERHQGLSKAHRISILEEGMKLHEVGIPPEDAQFLECVVKGTLISMADGTQKPVEDLRPGDEVLGWGNGPMRACVAAVGAPPIKSLVRITTARGRELTATVDHPCLARHALRTLGGRLDHSVDEWIPIGDLKVGNFVRIGLGNVSNTSADMDSLEADRAWFLGAMVGDGYIRKGGCTFSNDDEGVIARMRTVVGALGGELIASTSRRYDYDIKTGGSGCVGSVIRGLFNVSGLVGSHSHDKRVPDIVFRGGPTAWAAFLSGYLDTDGSVGDPAGKNQPKVYWSSVNRELLCDCQHLLALLNINSGIYAMHPGGAKMVNGHECEVRPTWGLFVVGAEQLRALAGLLSPAHSMKKVRLEACLSLPRSRYRVDNWIYDRVIKVEHLGPGETVGVEIAGIHTHITAGIVTHNTRKFQLNEIARIFRIPPHMLGDLERATFSNIEHQSIEFVVHTIRPWLVRWEQMINWKLLTPAERRIYFAEFVVDGLLRGDIQSRYQAYAVGRQNGWLSADDIRELENMNPLPDGQGKVYLVPLNMIPADQVGQIGRAKTDEDNASGDERSLKVKEQRALRTVTVRRRIRQQYKPLIRDAAQRVVHREVNDLRRKAKELMGKRDHEQFLGWLESYHQENREFIERQMYPIYDSFGRAINGTVADEIGGSSDISPELERFMRSYMEVYTTAYSRSSFRQLKAVIRDAIDEGIDPLDAINQRLDEWDEKRADKVAMEETVEYSNAFVKAAYVAAGVLRLRWAAYGKSCPYCESMNGKVIGIQGSFVQAGDSLEPNGVEAPMTFSSTKSHPPLHGGCDCDIVADI